jgi:hypothetical protein
MHKLKQEYGSVMAFVQNKRLYWDSTTPSGERPFTNPADYKILYNDWPYGIDHDIVHLVVWCKFPLKDDPVTDDLTTEARQEIEAFVLRTFCGVENGIPRGRLIWFKNWSRLKSIHALGMIPQSSDVLCVGNADQVEHFHVMLYRPSPDFVQKITDGDRPTSTDFELI